MTQEAHMPKNEDNDGEALSRGRAEGQPMLPICTPTNLPIFLLPSHNASSRSAFTTVRMLVLAYCTSCRWHDATLTSEGRGAAKPTPFDPIGFSSPN